jgi:hypothetical protein
MWAQGVRRFYNETEAQAFGPLAEPEKEKTASTPIRKLVNPCTVFGPFGTPQLNLGKL